MNDYTDRQRAALGAAPGICRALNPDRTFMCDLDEGHDGDHHGFELPTVTLRRRRAGMTRLYPRRRPRLETWTPPRADLREPEWNVNTHAREEHRAAANEDRVRYVRGLDERDVPSEDER